MKTQKGNGKGLHLQKKLLVCLIAVSAVVAPATYGGTIEFFDAFWSGGPFGNDATATATIGIDTSSIPNPGSYFNRSSIPSWFKSITMTVSGAGPGNGTFTLSDFQGLYWDTNGGTLNFGTQLLGQPTSGSPWGTTHDGTSGDFNLFGSSPTAPDGTFYFQLTTDQGSGGNMNLVSFAPAVPDQGSSLALLALGASGALALRRRWKAA